METTFYFNPKGADHNGNFGPSKEDPEWIVVKAHDMNEAITKLPKEHYLCVQRYWGMYNTLNDRKYDFFRDIVEETCGWAMPFTLMTEEEWSDFE